MKNLILILSTAIASILVTAITMQQFYSENARQLEVEQKTRIYTIFGEGDAGLIIADYLTEGETLDQYGAPVEPIFFYAQILPAIIPFNYQEDTPAYIDTNNIPN